MAIHPKQIKLIKTLQRAAGLDDDGYREMLWGLAKVKSCTELMGPKVDLVIRHLEKCAGQGGKGGAQAEKPAPQGGPRMATSRQMFVIRRIWARVSFAPMVDQGRALKGFIKRRFGVELLEWLTFEQASKVIEGLKAMEKRGG